MTPSLLDLQVLSPVDRAVLLAEWNREAMKDRSYELLPLGEDVAAFLRAKKQRHSENTRKAYESSLDKLARHFADLRVEDFEPPVGTERLIEYLDRYWGDSKPATYNVHLSATRSFFEWEQLRGRLHGDPCRGIDRAKKKQAFRATFSDDERLAILAAAGLRDRIALRLLFDYGLRRSSLIAVRFRDFDHQRRRLTIFTKGSKVRAMPLPEPELWLELERLILEVEARPDHFLMCVERPIPRAGRRRFPDQPMAPSTVHKWFYRRQEDAGITEPLHMHAARHTAAQRVLDATGNIVACQLLLGHSSIATTQAYVGLGDEELTRILERVLTGGGGR